MEWRIGDRVYSPYHNYGTIVEIDGSDKAYPITVKWDVSRYKIGIDLSTFTEDGYLFFSDKTENTKITKANFKLMDRVFYPYYGKGTVVGDDRTDVPFPIRVFWDNPLYKNEPTSSFTRDGIMSISRFVGSDEVNLILVKDIPKEETGGSEMGKIAGVINHDIAKKMHEDEEKRSPEGKKFKVGERVWSPYFGDGVVMKNVSNDNFPLEVHWKDKHLGAFDYFTEDGKYDTDGTKPEMGIYHIDPEHADKVLPKVMKELAEKDESTIERMEDALNKKVEDAVNPAHYKVEGLPEAIDIINHLMHMEQYEGFLWGNILKYAYRFGRKGDKAETAGKIAWYANQLKDLEEERK